MSLRITLRNDMGVKFLATDEQEIFVLYQAKADFAGLPILNGPREMAQSALFAHCQADRASSLVNSHRTGGRESLDRRLA